MDEPKKLFVSDLMLVDKEGFNLGANARRLGFHHFAQPGPASANFASAWSDPMKNSPPGMNTMVASSANSMFEGRRSRSPVR